MNRLMHKTRLRLSNWIHLYLITHENTAIVLIKYVMTSGIVISTQNSPLFLIWVLIRTAQIKQIKFSSDVDILFWLT